MKSTHFTRSTLPLFQATDFAIVGGSFAGMAAALELARAGRSVVLIEPRTYLGYEITATLRPWVPALPLGEYPELIAACIEASGTGPRQGEYPLHPDAVKICLEDRLLAAGVELVYASQPVGFNKQGLIIGNKSGRQIIECQAVLDCTPTALAARLSGASLLPAYSRADGEPRLAQYAITLEFEGVAFQEEGEVVQNVREWEIPVHLAGVVKRAITHRGCRPNYHAYRHGHNLIEVILELPRVSTPLELSSRYLTARRHALDFASTLLWENHFFRQAYLGSISQDIFGSQADPMPGPVPEWAWPLDQVIFLSELPASRFAAPAKGLFCLNEAARVDGDWFLDPLKASRIGTTLGRALKNWHEKPEFELARSANPDRASLAKTPNLEVREPESSRSAAGISKYP